MWSNSSPRSELFLLFFCGCTRKTLVFLYSAFSRLVFTIINPWSCLVVPRESVVGLCHFVRWLLFAVSLQLPNVPLHRFYVDRRGCSHGQLLVTYNFQKFRIVVVFRMSRFRRQLAQYTVVNRKTTGDLETL